MAAPNNPSVKHSGWKTLLGLPNVLLTELGLSPVLGKGLRDHTQIQSISRNYFIVDVQDWVIHAKIQF